MNSAYLEPLEALCYRAQHDLNDIIDGKRQASLQEESRGGSGPIINRTLFSIGNDVNPLGIRGQISKGQNLCP